MKLPLTLRRLRPALIVLGIAASIAGGMTAASAPANYP